MSATGVAIWEQAVSASHGETHGFPEAPGVYVFAEAYADGFDVRYVGRAADLDERIYAHLGGSGGNDCLQGVLDNNFHNVKIAITLQPNAKRRMNVEHTCYMYYHRLDHRLCNAHVPQGAILKGMSVPF